MPSIISRVPVAIVLLWAAISISIYYFYVGDIKSSIGAPIQNDDFFDAVVFITMGSLSQNKMIDVTLSSIRKVGKWKGDIYILTDRPECFKKAIKTLEVKIISIPTTPSFMMIKAVKPSIFKYLPTEVKNILYLDSDIITTRNLNTFIRHISTLATPTDTQGSEGSEFNLGMFRDSKGHLVGFCSGCDKWHTGVMWLSRYKGQDCLKAWETLILSGKYSADQEAIDYAEKVKLCTNILTFPVRHLLFARDYLAVALTSSRTFLHLTSAVRLHTQDYFYREIVVPSLMSPVIRELDQRYLDEPISCAVINSTTTASASSSSSSDGTATSVPRRR